MILYDKRQNGVYVYTHSAEPRVSKGFLIVPAVLVKQFLELRLWFLKGTKNKFESAWYLYGLCVQTELCPSQLGPKSHTRKLKAKTAKEKALMAKSILSSLRTHKSIGHQYVGTARSLSDQAAVWTAQNLIDWLSLSWPGTYPLPASMHSDTMCCCQTARGLRKS